MRRAVVIIRGEEWEITDENIGRHLAGRCGVLPWSHLTVAEKDSATDALASVDSDVAQSDSKQSFEWPESVMKIVEEVLIEQGALLPDGSVPPRSETSEVEPMKHKARETDALIDSMPPPLEIQPVGDELSIKWHDGTESFIPLERLRRSCPCSDCKWTIDRRPKSTLDAASFTLIDIIRRRRVIQPVWADEHSKGVFPFGLLRKLANHPMAKPQKPNDLKTSQCRETPPPVITPIPEFPISWRGQPSHASQQIANPEPLEAREQQGSKPGNNFPWKGLLISGCVLIAMIAVRNHNLQEKRLRSIQLQNFENQTKRGYRLQPDGSTLLATTPQLWKEGSAFDYKYQATDLSGNSADIYAVRNEKKIFGKVRGYDSDLNYGDISIEGEWIGNGQIRAVDAEGNEYQFRVIE